MDFCSLKKHSCPPIRGRYIFWKCQIYQISVGNPNKTKEKILDENTIPSPFFIHKICHPGLIFSTKISIPWNHSELHIFTYHALWRSNGAWRRPVVSKWRHWTHLWKPSRLRWNHQESRISTSHIIWRWNTARLRPVSN